MAETVADDATRRHWRRVRIWSSQPRAQRLRRPTDILLLVLAVVGLAFLAIRAPGPTKLDTSLTAVLTSLSGILDWFYELAYLLLVVWAAVLVLLPLLSRGRRRLLLDYLLVAAVALGAACLVGWLSGTDWSTSLHAFVTVEGTPVYLATRVAVVTAVIVTASPYLTLSLRYVGRGIVLMGATAAVALGVTYPIGALAGILVGIGAAALVHLGLGSPERHLTPDQVALALGDLGVDVDSVEDAPVQMAGVALVVAHESSGRDLLVKVYGRDAWDSQVVGSVWTAATRRGERPHLASGRRERVEHEALVLLMAERAGVPVPPVVAAGQADDGDALLVTVVPGRPLASLAPDEVTDELLDATWNALARQHGVGISHGRVDAYRVAVRPDGTPVLADFAEARLAADHGDLMTDRARLLVAVAVIVGHDRAVAGAVRAIGSDGLADVLPYLQPAVLDRTTRRAVSSGTWSLDDLRTAAVEAAGTEPPPLERLRRVTVKSALIVALVAVLVYGLVSKLAGVDFASIVSEISDAKWGWLIAALLMSPTVQVAYSLSTLGASTAPLRYFPVLMLQYAIQFIALTLPATAARLALEVRFFQRFGIAAAAAISIGVIDSVSGFAVQIVLLLLILLTGLPGFTAKVSDSTSSSSGSSSHVVLWVIGLVLVAGVVSLLVPATRRRLRQRVPQVRAALVAQASSARSSLTVLRRPGKVATMLSGNLGAQVLQAVILGLCLEAFGSHLHLSQLILVNTAVSLFAGLMPVPGGVGVAEAGYIAGLQACGVPAPVAVSTAITFRLVTFYLPPLWGALSMRWLRKHEYV